MKRLVFIVVLIIVASIAIAYKVTEPKPQTPGVSGFEAGAAGQGGGGGGGGAQ